MESLVISGRIVSYISDVECVWYDRNTEKLKIEMEEKIFIQKKVRLRTLTEFCLDLRSRKK